jgi:hypothetical protein
MDVKYSLKKLEVMAKCYPGGVAVLMLARGRIVGDQVFLDENLQREMRHRMRPRRLWVFSIDNLQLSAPLHPAGYVDFILERGKKEGDNVVLDEAAHKELQEKFLFPQAQPLPSSAPRPPVPTLAAITTNFTKAMAGWAGAGFKVVERKEYERRQAICSKCEYWEPDARLGLGKCKRCFCSKFKLWLATSKCPDRPPRW